MFNAAANFAQLEARKTEEAEGFCSLGAAMDDVTTLDEYKKVLNKFATVRLAEMNPLEFIIATSPSYMVFSGTDFNSAVKFWQRLDALKCAAKEEKIVYDDELKILTDCPAQDHSFALDQ